MKKLVIILLLFCGFALAQEKTYQVPESELTEQQKAKFEKSHVTAQDVHEWAGVGKEIGDAVNSSLNAVTVQANNFAQTPVGKLTAVMVMWKIMGSDAYHLGAGILELLVFVPIFLWSYRKMCMARRIATASEGPFWNRKKTYQVIPYDRNDDFSPRHGHSLALGVFVLVWVATMFS